MDNPLRRPDAGAPVHDGLSFTWLKNHGTACISDLNRTVHGRVWKDAADIGFVVRSHRTEREVVFTMLEREYDHEGDTTGWLYQSYCGKFTIRVYND